MYDLKCFCISLLILLLSLVLDLQAQGNYFTKIIPGARDYDYAWGLTTDKDGYIYCTGSYCYNEDVQCIKIGKVDLSGNEVWLKKYIRYPRFQGTAVTPSEKHIYLAGNLLTARKDSLYYNIRPFVMKLDQHGDSLWIKDYVESQDPESHVQNVTLQLKYNKNYLYLLEGVWDKSIPYSTYLRVVKVDTNGVVIWKTILNTHDVAKRTFQPISRNLQFDEVGNIMVCAQVDSFCSQCDAVPYQCVMNQDGKILKEGRLFPLEYASFFTFYPIEGAFTKQHASVWISHHDYSAGHDELLVYSFDSTHKKTWRTIVEAHAEALEYPFIYGWSNGDMVARYETKERILFDNNPGTGLLRISPEGALKWKRRYYMYPWVKTPIILNFGWLAETAEGGIIASGSYRYRNQWREDDDDVLLVKLDSMGCPYKDCVLSDTIIILKETKITSEENPEKNLYRWKLTNDKSEIHIEFDPHIKKPELNIILSDLSGRIITQQRLKTYNHQIAFSISTLREGMYIISMNSDKLIKAFRFIK